MATLQLVGVGFFPKRTDVPVGWTFSPVVTEICSVSECAAKGPPGWIDRWLHNDLLFYDRPETARGIIPPGEEVYSIFAYRLLPELFRNGSGQPCTIASTAQAPGPGFRSIGFDAVSKSVAAGFECSPLSCSGYAKELPVNPYCLFDTLEEAISGARRFSNEEPEPGPYYVLEVLREGT